MIKAELHGKVSADVRGSEDVLTSHVFSVLSYLDDLDILEQFLCAATNRLNDPLRVGKLKSAQVYFWPGYQLRNICREADALLLLENTDDRRIAIAVEAKYQSGLSNREFMSDSISQINVDLFPQSYFCGQQLHDTYLGIQKGTWISRELDGSDLGPVMAQIEQRLVLYVTRHYAFPEPDLKESLEKLGARKESETQVKAEREIYWVSWRALHAILKQAELTMCENQETGRFKMLRDLRDVLSKRDLEDFGVSFQSLKDLDCYQSGFGDDMLFQGLQELEQYTVAFG